MTKEHDIRAAGLILAAGDSSRYGGIKQLASVAGEPLLGRVVRAALSSGLEKTILVLGFMADEIIRELGESLRHPTLSVVTNTEYKEGMAASIRVGMTGIDPSFARVMIILGDFPLLSPGIIDSVLEAHRTSGKGICVPVRDNRWGHPVCLSRRYFEDLTNIEGDIGARNIIRSNWPDVYAFPITEEGCFFDVDTKEDIEALKQDYGLDKPRKDSL